MTAPRAVYRAFWFVHRVIRRMSGGRIGTRIAQGDRKGTLFLHTVGRKSGQPRVNGLYYIVEGSDFVVVASNVGSDRDPAWWLNLRARPDAEVELAGLRRPVSSRAATDDEAARLWPRLDVANPDYAAYRANTQRPIPVVILEPR